MKRYTIFIFIILLIFTVTCHAHPGRTDKYGGHTNKATGEYHYHNADGTTTSAPKPAAPIQQTEQNKPEANINQTSDKVVSVVVDGDKKTVQPSAKDTIKVKQPTIDNTPTDVAEPTITTDENGDTFIYIPQTTPYKNINIFIFLLLLVFAVIGWCAISPIMCVLFRKIEEKNSSFAILLHIPYLLFWPTSLVGVLLYKLYNKIAPRKKNDSSEYDDDFDDDYDTDEI